MNSITIEELKRLVEEIKEQVEASKKSALLETPEQKIEATSEEEEESV